METTSQPEPAVEPATPNGRHRSRSPRRWRYPKVAAGLLAVLFFAGPAVARLAGDRPETIENHPLTPFPSIKDGWQIFPELNAWAVDHLPLRDRAVKANDDISTQLFHELPATAGSRPLAILGKDGWLFYDIDIVNACASHDHIAQLDDPVRRLAAIAGQATGSFTMLIAPDKTSIETDKLPDRYPQDTCAAEARTAMHQQLAADPLPGYVDLFDPITQVKQEHGAAYMPQDTHWNGYGRAAYATTLAEHLDPSVMAGTTVTATGPQTSGGDLNAMRGRPGPTTFDGAAVNRPGVTTHSSHQTLFNEDFIVSTSTTTGAPLIPGRTVLLGDSFTESSLPELQPFFSELVFVFGQPTTPETLANLMRSANNVVFEEVERYYMMFNGAPTLQPDYLDELQRLVAGGRSTPSAG